MATDTAPVDGGDKQKLTGQQIHDQAPPGWAKVLDKLIARFETGDFNTGAALVTKIAEAADEMNHHPDVDLRYPHLTVSLMSHDVDAITPRDIRLATTISRLAAEAEVSPAEHAPDVLELALDTPDFDRDKPFWAAILGYRPGAHPRDLVDPAGRSVNVWFQDTDSDAPDRQRWHLDISVPPRGRRGADPGGDRRRRAAGQRRPRPGLLGARRPRRQPRLHLHLGEPGLSLARLPLGESGRSLRGAEWRDGCPIPRDGWQAKVERRRCAGACCAHAVQQASRTHATRELRSPRPPHARRPLVSHLGTRGFLLAAAPT